MSSASKRFFFLFLYLLQLFTNFWFNALVHLGKSKKNKPVKMLTQNVSSIKPLSKHMLQFVGNFLEPNNAQKMTEMSKKWSNIKIYENIFPNESVAVFRNVNTKETLWETIKFKKIWKPLPDQGELVSHLRQNDVVKWNDVFLWFDENRNELIKNKYQSTPFLKALMLATAENVDVTFTDPEFGNHPLMIAAVYDDIDSILTLIKRNADVNGQDNFGQTAFTRAACYKSMNACATLLENSADIDAIDHDGWTTLMWAAIYGKKDVFEFLIKKGANKNLTNNDGETALQLARFQMR